LVFSILTVFYWRERRRRGTTGRLSVFPVFTLACAAAFLDNLLLQVFFLDGSASPLGRSMVLLRDVTTGLLPPLMLHLVFETESPGLARRRAWRALLIAFYVAALAGAAPLPAMSADLRYRAPAITLAAAGAAGLLLQFSSRSRPPSGQRAHRIWIRALLLLMLISAIATLGGWGVWVGQVPDYLVLAFFAISLYYRERLAFFDLLVKRAVFLCLGLAILSLCFAIRPPSEWSPWIYAAVLLAFWLLGSWVYPHVAGFVDHVWLRRPYTAASAERQFIRAIQIAAAEDDLLSRAAAGFQTIFRTRAEISSHRPQFPIPRTAWPSPVNAATRRSGTFGWPPVLMASCS
jgi:hypothetical protein